MLYLLADGMEEIKKTFRPADGNIVTFESVPSYINGKAVKYTVIETGASGFDVTYPTTATDAADLTVVNTRKGSEAVSLMVRKVWNETINIIGSITWDDVNDADGIRPSSVVVNLFANGKKAYTTVVNTDGNESVTAVKAFKGDGEMVMTKAAAGSSRWVYGFTGLPKSADGAAGAAGVAGSATNVGTVQTGDDNNLALLIGLMAASLLAIVGVFIYRRRKKQ